MKHLPKPRQGDDLFEKIKCYENSIKAMIQGGFMMLPNAKQDKDHFTRFKHPASKGEKSIWVFKDNGIIHSETPRLPTKDGDINTTSFIRDFLEQDPVEWARLHTDIISPKKLNGKAPELLPGIRTAQEVLDEVKDKPDLEEIFDTFLLEKSLTYLFGDDGLGKTAFAVDVALGVCLNRDYGEHLKAKGKVRGAIFYNFEMVIDEFKLRRLDRVSREYPERLPPNFLMRFGEELNELISGKVDPIERLAAQAAQDVKDVEDVGLIVVDNLTYLTNGGLIDPSEADKLVKALINIARENNCALLVVAHTPKARPDRMMQKDDMGGSKQLQNLAQFRVGLRQSYKDPDLIMFINFKARFSRLKFHNKLPVFRKYSLHEKAPLMIEPLPDLVREQDHIKRDDGGGKLQETTKQTEKRTEKKIALRMVGEVEVLKIAGYLNKTAATIYRWIKEGKDLQPPLR